MRLQAWLLVALLGLVQGLRRASNEVRGFRADGEDLVEGPAQEGVLQLLSFNEEPPVEDDGAMHVASATCRAGCHYLVSLIRSFAAQAILEGGKKPYFHAFAEKLCYHAVRDFVKSEPQILDAIHLRVWNVDAIDGLPINATKHGKQCTMVRLFMPRLFPRLSRLIYLDMDTLVLNSLRPAWNLTVPVIAMGENDELLWRADDAYSAARHCPTWKNGTVLVYESPTPGAPDTCYVGLHGLNAGVLVVNLTGWRAHGVDREIDYWSRLFLSGEIDMRMNDQDILNLIVLQHMDYHAPLPCEMNLLHTHRWMCLFTKESNWRSWRARNRTETLIRNSRQPVVVHDKFGHGVDRQIWRWLYNRTIAYSTLVVAGHVRNASSLCGTFGCGSMIMEEPYECGCNVGIKGKHCNCVFRDYAAEDNEFKHVYPAGAQ